jgi:uncharacterized coiled-coil DUF342 family protein
VLWATIGLSAFALVEGLVLAIWISRLKDRAQEWMQKHAKLAASHSALRIEKEAAQEECRRLTEQLQTVRTSCDEMAELAASGRLDTTANIANELRVLLKPAGDD